MYLCSQFFFCLYEISLSLNFRVSFYADVIFQLCSQRISLFQYIICVFSFNIAVTSTNVAGRR
jgi:hypothetical protein